MYRFPGLDLFLFLAASDSEENCKCVDLTPIVACGRKHVMVPEAVNCNHELPRHCSSPRATTTQEQAQDSIFQVCSAHTIVLFL